MLWLASRLRVPRDCSDPHPGRISIGLAMMQSVQMPAPILLIAREPLVAGRENEYREIEEETARLSAKLGCPHPCLAMESLTGPKEIWWFNGFDSSEDQRQARRGLPEERAVFRNAQEE